MRRSNRSLALVFSAGLFLACSSSSSDPAKEDASTAAAPVTAQSACEHEFRVRVERCDGADIAPATLSTARTRYVASCVGALSLTGSTRTAEDVEACAKAVEAEECGVAPVLLAACVVQPGTLRAGSACNVDTQCQSGHCDLLATQAKGKGCGVCLETVAEGDSCDPEHPACAIGTLCIGSATDKSPRCRRAAYVDENASCDGYATYCHPGFMCASIGGAPSTCIPVHTVGGECPADAACATDTFCSETTHTCANLANVGEACDSQTPCKSGLGCDSTTKTCAPLTFAEPGVKCGGSVACREGVCGQGTGAPTCPALVEDGKGCLEGAHMTCLAPATCIAGACVMQTTATCQ